MKSKSKSKYKYKYKPNSASPKLLSKKEISKMSIPKKDYNSEREDIKSDDEIDLSDNWKSCNLLTPAKQESREPRPPSSCVGRDAHNQNNRDSENDKQDNGQEPLKAYGNPSLDKAKMNNNNCGIDSIVMIREKSARTRERDNLQVSREAP